MRILSRLLIVITILSPFIHGQTLDTPPQGIPNIRAVQGGGSRVRIDSTTPLPDLIKRLAGRWNLVETGKAYWIGYTDDMFSIAAFKDAAVEPLLNLLKESRDLHTKNGVILTLHLIGINSTIIGRFDEKFLNVNARQALLGLINDNECGDLAVELLARDPWPSDIPLLIETLARGKQPRKVLINALFRYVQGDTPFRQDIDETWNTIAIDFRNENGQKHLGELKIVVREKETDDPEKVNNILRSELVLQWGKKGRILRQLMTSDNGDGLKRIFGDQKPTEALYDLFLLSKEKVSDFSYCDLNEELWHTIEPEKIVIVGPEMARQMWLNYFKKNGSPSPKK